MALANNDNNNNDSKDDIEEKTASSGGPSYHEYSTLAHQPGAQGEAMSVYLGPIPSNLILEYVDGVFLYSGENTISKPLSREQRQQFRLFGVRVPDLVVSHATKVAQLVLHGGKKEIEEALGLVKKYPDVLRCQKVTVKDRLGRVVPGKTPLQIAAMAGDLDLAADSKEEERGAVERLISAGDLLQEEITEQLKVIMSPEAIAANEARNQRILLAITTFGESLMEIETNAGDILEELGAFRARCQEPIAQLEQALQADTEEPITQGYVFDPKILAMAAEWFENNLNRFRGLHSLQSDIFWVNGFGKLQSKLSSRDAQVIFAGISKYIESRIIPDRRSLTNFNGNAFLLGQDFYYGYYGGSRASRNMSSDLFDGGWGGAAAVRNLVSSKSSSLAKLMQPAEAIQSNKVGANLM